MKQVFNISSGAENEVSDRVLSIRVGERHFGFAITGADAAQLYRLAWYTDEEVDEKVLEDLYRQHPELQETYSDTRICYDHPQSVLVPSQLYREENMALLLKTMHGPAGAEEVCNEPLENWQLRNVYAVPKTVREWTRHYFSKVKQHHNYTLGIQNIDTTFDNGMLMIDFRTDDFSLIVSAGNKILLAQTFIYTTPADVIYYLIKTCQDLSLSQENVQLLLSGLVDKQSVLYREIYQYFINVSFRETSWTLPETGEEMEFPSHFFTSLNDLARCES